MSQQKRQAKRFRLCVKGRMIPDGNGGEKPLWLEVGQITAFTNEPLAQETSFSVEMNHMPNVQINAFPIEKKNFSQQNQQSNNQPW